jgi:hypothetical protein
LAGLKQVANGDFAMHGEAEGLRVVYLNLLLVYPDPVQPRRILPERIYQQFWVGRLWGLYVEVLAQLVAAMQLQLSQVFSSAQV